MKFRVSSSAHTVRKSAVSIQGALSVKGRSFLLPRLALFMACSTGVLFTPSLQAQNLTATEKAKVTSLKGRLTKATTQREKADANLSKYRVFRVMGEVKAGDTVSADVYGIAISTNGGQGAGHINEKTYLTVTSPVNANYNNGSYSGYCTFLGVIKGQNTYYPIERQPDYIAAHNEAEKWRGIEKSIEAEIDAVYLPYQRDAKNQAIAEAARQTRLAQENRERDAALAATEAQNQRRVTQAREELEKEKRSVELAKEQLATKESADAEIARLKAELEKTKAEKAQLDAEAQKRAQDAANQKAKELQETEAKNEASVETLKNAPSVIAGVQLGKIRLGMSEAQVLQLMGTPAASLQLRKINTDSESRVAYYTSFIPRKIRRDRYFLKPTEGMDIFYEGFSAEELQYHATERGLPNIKAGELKKDFIFDVFYLNGKVVQIDSDSPQFFTADRFNIESPSDALLGTQKTIASGFLLDYRQKPQGGNWDGETGSTRFGTSYIVNREKGLSLCLEALSATVYTKNVPDIPSPFPRSRVKLIVHAPNTFPYTGDFQKGISVFNKKDGRSDAENVEERMYDSYLNPTATQAAVSNAVEPARENAREKVKEKIGGALGGIFRRR